MRSVEDTQSERGVKTSGLFRGEYPIEMQQGEVINSYRTRGAIEIHKRRLVEGPIYIVSFNKEQISFSDVKPLFEYDEYSELFSSEPHYIVFNLEGVGRIEEQAFDVLAGWYRYNQLGDIGYTAFVNIDPNLRKLLLSYELKPDLKKDIQSANGNLEDVVMGMEQVMKSRINLH